MQIPVASPFTGEGQVDRETGTIVDKGARHINILTTADDRPPTWAPFRITKPVSKEVVLEGPAQG